MPGQFSELSHHLHHYPHYLLTSYSLQCVTKSRGYKNNWLAQHMQLIICTINMYTPTAYNKNIWICKIKNHILTTNEKRHEPVRSSTIIFFFFHFWRTCNTRRTWRSFKEHQVVQCWRGARGKWAWGSRLSSWCRGWSSGTLPGDPHQSPCVHRERCLTHIPAWQQGGGSFLPLLILLHHTTPANLQQHDRGASKVREPPADSLADMWQMGDACVYFYFSLWIYVSKNNFCVAMIFRLPFIIPNVQKNKPISKYKFYFRIKLMLIIWPMLYSYLQHTALQTPQLAAMSLDLQFIPIYPSSPLPDHWFTSPLLNYTNTLKNKTNSMKRQKHLRERALFLMWKCIPQHDAVSTLTTEVISKKHVVCISCII